MRGMSEEERVPDLPEVIRRYLDGEALKDLALECGKHRVTLYRWMLSEMGGKKEYREFRHRVLMKRISDADEALEGATNAVEVTKRVAQAKFARFDYERRAPELYGPKQEVKHSGVVPTLSIVLLERPSGGALYDGTPDRALPAPGKDGKAA